MACRALSIRLYSLRTCDECPLYSEVSALADTLRSDSALAAITIPISEALVEEVARDIKLDYGVRSDESPALRPIRCWRFPEGYCRKFPVYTKRKVSVVLRRSERNDEIFMRAIEPAIRQANFTPYRIDEEMLGAEEMCRACENFQEGDIVLLSIDDWSANSVFLTGIAYGVGRRVILIKNTSLQPVPLIENMEHDTISYTNVEELKQRLLANIGSGRSDENGR
jgi:hypothetical protein